MKSNALARDQGLEALRLDGREAAPDVPRRRGVIAIAPWPLVSQQYFTVPMLSASV
jgi:hypothetical protein